MAECVYALKDAVFKDLLPHMDYAELFGMGHADDSLNSLVLGVWQGAVKCHEVLKLSEVMDALVQNKVRDLFHQTTRDLAAKGHPYSLRLMDKLDEVYFRMYS